MSNQEETVTQLPSIAQSVIVPLEENKLGRSIFTYALLGLGAIAGLYFAFKFIRKPQPQKAENLFRITHIYEQIVQKIEHAPIVKLTSKQTTRLASSKYPIEISLSNNIHLKPVQPVEAVAPQQIKKNPFLPPFEQGMQIMQLGMHHRLIFNKFAFQKNHVLVITSNFQSQTSQLNQNDFFQSLLVMKALNGFYFYNSGKDSGGSQPHKHIQCMPQQAMNLVLIEKLDLFAKRKVYEGLVGSQINFDAFEFQHGMYVFEDNLTTQQLAEKTHQAYKNLYNVFIRTRQNNVTVSYNLIGTYNFILLVPRRKENTFELASVNAVGLAGSIITKNEQNYRQLLKHTPEEILNDITFNSKQQLDDYKNQMIV